MPHSSEAVVTVAAAISPRALIIYRSSWNRFGGSVSDALLRQCADAIVSSGLRDAGYMYLNLDDGWARNRSADGTIVADPALFPNGIKAVADYVHSKVGGLPFATRSAQRVGRRGLVFTGRQRLRALLTRAATFPIVRPALTPAHACRVHLQGLKFGIYTARGSTTCMGRPGSDSHEVQDAATYASWSVFSRVAARVDLDRPRCFLFSQHCAHGRPRRCHN